MCMCVCFPYSKRKSKRWREKKNAAFSSSGNHCTLVGSSRLLPWQLPVNIPPEFSHRRGESATFSLQTNRLDIPAENEGAEPGGRRCNTCTCDLTDLELSTCGSRQIKVAYRRQRDASVLISGYPKSAFPSAEVSRGEAVQRSGIQESSSLCSSVVGSFRRDWLSVA